MLSPCAQLLRYTRVDLARMTQAEVAAAAGCSRATIAMIETGRAQVIEPTFMKLLAAMGYRVKLTLINVEPPQVRKYP